MADLIAELEQAEAGSRELDKAVMLQTGFVWETFGGEHWARGAYPYGEDRPPNFTPTTSLDAALTLVPEGWLMDNLCQLYNRDGPQGWVCILHKPGERRANNDFDNGSATSALAVCIAALKARA